MLKIFTIILFSISILGNSQDILTNLTSKIIQNTKNNKVSFVVFNLDNTLIDSSKRFNLLFNNYLKKSPLKQIKTYLKDKDFNNLELSTILNEIDNLKLTLKQKEKLKKYLQDNINSLEAIDSDISKENSVNFVNELYKNGAFIIYITKRDIKDIAPIVKTLNKLNFPIGLNKTTLIMNVNIKSIRNILSKWINMGEIISIFDSNINLLEALAPYFKQNQLFFISNNNLPNIKVTTISKF
jgi:hypothetical protein